MIDFSRILTSSFNWNPIFVVRFELDQNRHSNSDALESEALTIFDSGTLIALVTQSLKNKTKTFHQNYFLKEPKN